MPSMPCYGSYLIASILADQDRADIDEKMLDQFHREVLMTALETISNDAALWEKYYTTWCPIENLPESARDQIAEAIRLLQLNRDVEAVSLLRAASTQSAQEAAERYADAESARLYSEWLSRGRKAA